MRGRAYVRVMSMWGEPLWLAVEVGFPFFSSVALALLYQSAGMSRVVGFAVLGGIMISFWGNVLWGMASQFSWDKQVGLFELYISSPASLTAILMGMSLGGVINTVPSTVFVAIFGWLAFHPMLNPDWLAVGLTFVLTLAGLYCMGMAMSSLYLAYGREAESLNEALHEPVSMISGVYFPSIGQFSPFPFAVQAFASLIPLTLGMYALRAALFFGQGLGGIWEYLAALLVMAIVLLFVASRSLKLLEEKGRRTGSITVRLR
jgi:ABC-2 type transport system permease protein